jgi:hypothetical protein
LRTCFLVACFVLWVAASAGDAPPKASAVIVTAPPTALVIVLFTECPFGGWHERS